MTEAALQKQIPKVLYIGIDPGTTTGLALWPKKDFGSLKLMSGPLIEIYQKILRHPFWVGHVHESKEILIRIEDARLRKWYGKQSSAKLQGAGSIKRDCAIWEEICNHHGWNYEMVHPIKGGTKWPAKIFNNITGYRGRSNEHERDAAMLVYGL